MLEPMACSLSWKASTPPKRYAPSIARPGFQIAKMTSATAIHPRPAVMASALGCDGKWAIHPAQIDIINEVFTPSQAEIDLAAKVIEANAQARAAGKGAVAVEGRMVDQATVRLASQLWEQARHLQLI